MFLCLEAVFILAGQSNCSFLALRRSLPIIPFQLWVLFISGRWCSVTLTLLSCSPFSWTLCWSSLNFSVQPLLSGCWVKVSLRCLTHLSGYLLWPGGIVKPANKPPIKWQVIGQKINLVDCSVKYLNALRLNACLCLFLDLINALKRRQISSLLRVWLADLSAFHWTRSPLSYDVPRRRRRRRQLTTPRQIHKEVLVCVVVSENVEP